MEMLKKIMSNPIKSVFFLICISGWIFLNWSIDHREGLPEYLKKGLGTQVFHTTDSSACTAAVYSFSDEWYNTVMSKTSEFEAELGLVGWWQTSPIDENIREGMTLKSRAFSAAWCNGGFKEYSNIFFEAIDNEGNVYEAGDITFIIIVRKEKLVFFTTFK